MFGRRKVEQQCLRRNETERNVNGAGRTRLSEFCRSISGSALISGRCPRVDIMAVLIDAFSRQPGSPIVVLSGNPGTAQALSACFSKDTGKTLTVNTAQIQNYSPMEGMSESQILHLLIQAACEENFSQLDSLAVYAMALMTYAAQAFGSLSLPLLADITRCSDDTIISHAREKGVSETETGMIEGNPAAGAVLRTVLRSLQMALPSDMMQAMTVSGSANQTGAGQGPGPDIRIYSQSGLRQSIINQYLRDELYVLQTRYPGLRIIADELLFTGPDDALLNWLMGMKRQPGVTLTMLSASADIMLMEEENLKGFEYQLVFPHASQQSAEAVARSMGQYSHQEIRPHTTNLPHLFFSLRESEGVSAMTEQRCRVRPQDLGDEQAGYRVAVKMKQHVELVLLPLFYRSDSPQGFAQAVNSVKKLFG